MDLDLLRVPDPFQDGGVGGKGMTKIKVLDLAREVGMEDDKLLLKLKRMGVKVKDKKSEEPEKMKSLIR